MMLSTQLTLSARRCTVSWRPTISAASSPAASCHAAARAFLSRKLRALVGIEAPVSAQRRLHVVAEHDRAQAPWCRPRSRPATASAVTGRFKRLAVGSGQVQGHVVRIGGRKHQRRSLHRQHQRRLSRAVNLLGIHRVQRRQLSLFDRRHRHHQHRFGIVERRRRVERESELVAARRRERRDVLILRGVEGVEDPSRYRAPRRCRGCNSHSSAAACSSPPSPDRCPVPRSTPRRWRCCDRR